MPKFCAVVGCGSQENRDENFLIRTPVIRSRGYPEFQRLKAARRRRLITALKRVD